MGSNTLLKQLMESLGLSEKEAAKALTVVADFAKERFPILEGTINAYIRQEIKHTNPDLLSDL